MRGDSGCCPGCCHAWGPGAGAAGAGACAVAMGATAARGTPMRGNWRMIGNAWPGGPPSTGPQFPPGSQLAPAGCCGNITNHVKAAASGAPRTTALLRIGRFPPGRPALTSRKTRRAIWVEAGQGPAKTRPASSAQRVSERKTSTSPRVEKEQVFAGCKLAQFTTRHHGDCNFCKPAEATGHTAGIASVIPTGCCPHLMQRRKGAKADETLRLCAFARD
jgi:hypothetical protein